MIHSPLFRSILLNISKKYVYILLIFSWDVKGQTQKNCRTKIFSCSSPDKLGGDSTRQILCIEIVHVQTCNSLMRQALDLRQEIAHRHRAVKLAA